MIDVSDFEKVELTTEELESAILEGKKKKWFSQRNSHYWQIQDPDFGKQIEYNDSITEMKHKITC